MDMNLTAKQRRFAIEFVKAEAAERPITQAQIAINAGYGETSASEMASENLRNPRILQEIQEVREQHAVTAGLSKEWILDRWMRIASADPSKLIKTVVGNCRYCNGLDHQYQWREPEYHEALSRAIAKKQPAPEMLGGFGYHVNADPHPDCPECGGAGIERTLVTATDKLTGSEKLLYAGVKQTKDGIQVLMRDQDAAMLNLAKFLGMMVERKELSGPDGAPIPVANLKAEDFTDDQLAAYLQNATDS